MLEELQFNITRHFMVPQHIVLSKEKRKQMLQDRQINLDDLPIIKRSDPVARYLGLSPHDIVFIR